MANPNRPGFKPPRGNPHWQQHRFAPFPALRGRGRGRGGHFPVHHNRVLVNQNGSSNTDAPPEFTETRPAVLSSSPPRTQQSLGQQSTSGGKHAYQASHPTQPQPDVRLMDIDGNKYRVSEDGSTLKRITPLDVGPQTPSEFAISGVKFFRSKNGNNLYREDKVKELARKQAQKRKKLSQLCPRFNTTGSCPEGRNCQYAHNVNKVAICKEYLRDSCPIGLGCDLSHDPTPNRSPACIHFLRGNCTNPDCRYTHVKPDPGANVCRDFATLGYCEKGASCAERHVNECPDYANTGACSKSKCRLPHIDRAGQLRKIAGVQNIPTQMANGSSNPTSDKEDKGDGNDGVDSDDLDEDTPMLAFPNAHGQMNGALSSFSEQQDYIHFDADA